MEQATCSTQDCSEPSASRGLCGKCYGKAWRRGSFTDHPPSASRHIVTNADRETRTGVCSLCGPVEVKYRRDRGTFECRTAVARRRQSGSWNTPETLRRYRLRRKYGLSVEQYEEMYEALEGACEICRTPIPVLHVDHDHETGQVRGLLCRPCNQGLGHFRDDLDLIAKAGVYLARSRRDLEFSHHER